MLRVILFIVLLVLIFPLIFHFMKRLMFKYNNELNNPTLEDCADAVEESKQILNQRIKDEEKIIKHKNKILSKVKGKPIE